MSDSTAALTDENEQSLQALGKFLLDESAASPLETPVRGPLPHSGLPPSAAALAVNEASLKGESIQQRVQRVKASANPLLEASQPLLRSLSEMPADIADISQIEVLKRTLTSEINVFTLICEDVDIAWKKMTIVRYCLCTALDEAAHATDWGLNAGWARSNLLNHFEGDNDGGNKFFLLAGRLSVHPHEYADVLDIMLRILALGFEGRYSIIEDGDRQLMKIRQRLLALLQNTLNKVPPELSPQGLPVRQEKKKRARFYVPVRATLLLTTVLTASLFIWCKYHLLVEEHALTARIDAMTHTGFTPPAPVPRLRLAVLLRAEIEKKQVTVDENSQQSKVIFSGDSMFDSGSINVKAEMTAILARVATEIHRVNGEVLIVGHTDSTPISKPGIKDNQALSEKRADSVARLLIQAGVPANKIRIQGAGERQPLHSNQDPAGRAQNRRVEMFVTY